MTVNLLVVLLAVAIMLGLNTVLLASLLRTALRKPTVIVLKGGELEDEGDEGGGQQLPLHPDALHGNTQRPGAA